MICNEQGGGVLDLENIWLSLRHGLWFKPLMSSCYCIKIR